VLAGGAYDFAGRGIGALTATQLLPDGSIVASSDRGVLMLASANAQRLAVGMRDLSVCRHRGHARFRAGAQKGGAPPVASSGSPCSRFCSRASWR